MYVLPAFIDNSSGFYLILFVVTVKKMCIFVRLEQLLLGLIATSTTIKSSKISRLSLKHYGHLYAIELER